MISNPLTQIWVSKELIQMAKTPEELRELVLGVYRVIARTYHPDKNPNNPYAKSVFEKASNAWGLVKEDPGLIQQYAKEITGGSIGSRMLSQLTSQEKDSEVESWKRANTILQIEIRDLKEKLAEETKKRAEAENHNAEILPQLSNTQKAEQAELLPHEAINSFWIFLGEKIGEEIIFLDENLCPKKANPTARRITPLSGKNSNWEGIEGLRFIGSIGKKSLEQVSSDSEILTSCDLKPVISLDRKLVFKFPKEFDPEKVRLIISEPVKEIIPMQGTVFTQLPVNTRFLIQRRLNPSSETAQGVLTYRKLKKPLKIDGVLHNTYCEKTGIFYHLKDNTPVVTIS
mgnify:CR=1 FL=1